MAQVYDAAGREVRLGREIGRGGEGAVFEVPGTSAVAKLYLKQVSKEKASKLEAMVASASPELLKFTAWPTAALKDTRGAVVGFTMPMIPSSSREIHKLYSPKSRRVDFPNASFKFLVRAGANTARSFAAVHAKGHAIGDVNHGNILVSDKATVSLIDCDSYEIRYAGVEYVCGVGVSTYTPPELQNGSFSGVRRTPNHDCFGLGVLLFHLLFMGRHPFAGRFLGTGDMPIERAIEEFRFAFSAQQQRTRMLPPPFTLELADLTTPIASLFESAFSPAGVNGRPSAAMWVSALEALERNVRQCGSSLAHFYPSLLQSCPWCRIEGATAVVLFGVAFPTSGGVAGFALDRVWRAICEVVPPPPSPQTPQPQQFKGKVTCSVTARAVRQKRVGTLGLGITVLVIAVLIVSGAQTGALMGIVILGIGLYGCVKLTQKSKSIGRELNARVLAARANYDALLNRWKDETGDAAFMRRRAELEKASKDYSGLSNERLQRLQQLEKEKYQRQLKQHLERHRLEDASIPGIGSGRKDLLASYGIEDAYDVTYHALATVPGFGPALTGRLWAWRLVIERQFTFNSGEPSSPSDIKAVEADIAAKRIALERHLASGATELTFLCQRAIDVRGGLGPQVTAAAMSVATAAKDASLWPF